MIEIEGYDNFDVVGRGGFAVVYKATQVSVGREVAIKVLSDPNPDADSVRRFQRESKAVGALSWHPHIAAVVDAGTTAVGQAYIVFELLVGGSLEDRIADEPMPWQAAITSMIQVADATEAAHRADVLHRDIKPANILMNRLGVAKLADFGIASMQDGTKTETGMLATTVAHAAPELFDGAPSSTATDVYALGSTLHTLVTGHPPFAPQPGERVVTTIGRIAREAPPALDTSMIHPGVAAVVSHALAKQPQYRLRSAALFGQALQGVQRELGVAVTPMPVADADSTTELADGLPHTSGGAVHVLGPTAEPSSELRPDSRHVASADAHKPLSRTIGVLVVIAGLLAATVGGLLLAGAFTETDPITTTAGGVPIRSAEGLADTAMQQFPPLNAIDRNDETFWGIQPNSEAERNIAGTSYLIRFDGEHTLTSVGISNGSTGSLGRVSVLQWASTLEELQSGASTVVSQEVADAPGEHSIPVRITTDRIFLLIIDVHDPEAPNAGIAEILLETE